MVYLLMAPTIAAAASAAFWLGIACGKVRGAEARAVKISGHGGIGYPALRPRPQR